MSASVMYPGPDFKGAVPEEPREPSCCARCFGRRISICTYINGQGLARLRAMAMPNSYGAGDIIFGQGDVLDCVHIVTSGVIKLCHALADGQNQITGFLGPGDILGGITHTDGARGTATALTPVDICTFGRAEFAGLVADYPEFSQSLLVVATAEIEALNDHMILLGRKRAPQRLAAFLLMLSERWKAENEDSKTVHLPMSRADIADHLGVTKETVSRTFARLRSSRCISMPKPNIVMLNDRAALYDLAGLDKTPTRGIALGL